MIPLKKPIPLEQLLSLFLLFGTTSKLLSSLSNPCRIWLPLITQDLVNVLVKEENELLQFNKHMLVYLVQNGIRT